MTPNLHELANTPGAGKAKLALMEAGLWQARTEDDVPVWRVDVSVTISGTVWVNVAAPDKEAARGAAEQWCRDHPDLARDFGGYDRVECEAGRVQPTDQGPDE